MAGRALCEWAEPTAGMTPLRTRRHRVAKTQRRERFDLPRRLLEIIADLRLDLGSVQGGMRHGLRRAVEAKDRGSSNPGCVCLRCPARD